MRLPLLLGCLAVATATNSTGDGLVCRAFGDEVCDTATDFCPPCFSALNLTSPICVDFNSSGLCPEGFAPWATPNVTILPVITTAAPTTDTITLPPTLAPTPAATPAPAPTPSTTTLSTTPAPTTSQTETDANTRAHNEANREASSTKTATVAGLAIVGAVAAVATAFFVKRSKQHAEEEAQTPRRDALMTQRAPVMPRESQDKRYSEWPEINAVVSPQQGNEDLHHGTPMELWDELPILQRNRERELTLLEENDPDHSLL
ncbi:hypothetical protein ACHHYP_07122 [Achlya hypogyna]|uniref:Secreted protein n=1 Tax=Achlya hypogyna TaxID=1202772 RepID=A0A0A7CNL4_ACHHY|nr:secreted protein [Achlya hypogyna]OQR99279.1 hypothetical protein ACHHYP_07122 [Achlya hypogyna]